jgi:hypothetical protein
MNSNGGPFMAIHKDRDGYVGSHVVGEYDLKDYDRVTIVRINGTYHAIFFNGNLNEGVSTIVDGNTIEFSGGSILRSFELEPLVRWNVVGEADVSQYLDPTVNPSNVLALELDLKIEGEEWEDPY